MMRRPPEDHLGKLQTQLCLAGPFQKRRFSFVRCLSLQPLDGFLHNFTCAGDAPEGVGRGEREAIGTLGAWGETPQITCR